LIFNFIFIQDAVTAVDAVTEPYGVAVHEVADPTQADVTLNMDTTSAVGGYADGVLGCTTDAGQVTIIAGWNFYAGSDATQIGSAQYDFQTVVTHELGHALGLGHSTDSTSVMYATLNTGAVNRGLTAADLNVPDSDTSGACGLHADIVGRSANPSYGIYVFSPASGGELSLIMAGYQIQPDSFAPEPAALNAVLADWTAMTDCAGQVARLLEKTTSGGFFSHSLLGKSNQQDKFWSSAAGESPIDNPFTA
jgi:hypothetical protein